MVFLSWAAMPADRKHATVRALYDGTVRLVMSQEAIDEVRDVLNRPELRARLPRLTPERVERVIDETLRLAEWVHDVPTAFTWPHHPDDDHNFNLAIAARADRFVTREARIRDLESNFPADAARLRSLAPQLRIVGPHELAAELRADREAEAQREAERRAGLERDEDRER
jgi:predicted nucleic acid-binding protein